jgi:AbiU2
MAENLSAEQVREKHIRDMGPELGAVYNALSNDVAWLHAKWNQYRQLYARSPERIDFLNTVAGHFFGMIEDILLEDILLHSARLTDPPMSVGKGNLTLRRIPELVADVALRSELEELVEVAGKACESPRAWRHRRLAHRDLALALATSSDPLPGVSRADIEATLRAIRAVLNRLEMQYWQSETAYQPFIVSGGEADSVVQYLLMGVRAEQRHMERLRQGHLLPEALEPLDEI